MYLCVLGTLSRGGLVPGTSFGTITLVTVMMPDLGAGEGVVAGVQVCDVDGVEVVDAITGLDLIDELDELAGEGVDGIEDVLERKAGGDVFGSAEVVGMDIGGRGAGGRGFAETVRGGRIVE
jgi:hypothetical protein